MDTAIRRQLTGGRTLHPTVRVLTGLTASVAAVGALVFGTTSPDNSRPADKVSHQVRPAAMVTGEIPATVIRNQVLYCSLICPYLIKGVTTVPIAALGSPGVFVAAYATTGSVPRSTGIAAHSVSKPAHSAMTGIIVNDLTLVLPRAQNALTVAVVEGMKTAGGQDIDTGRARVLEALDQPITPNPPSTAIVTTEQQAAAVDGIETASAVLFQAPELLLLGATETANASADVLAMTGDVNAALATGDAHATHWLDQADSILRQAGVQQAAD